MADGLQELHEGLVAWWLGSESGGAELREVWDDAFRRYDSRLRALLERSGGDENAVLDSPKEMLIECFAASLSDHEGALSAFVQALPLGWERMLRDAVDKILTRPAGLGMERLGATGPRSAPVTPA